METPIDPRRISPSAARNRDPILAALRPMLEHARFVLEIASGSGEHALHLARNLPHSTFQPSEADPGALASIAAYVADAALPNLLPPLALDVTAASWPARYADAVLTLNMIHISPWEATLGLLAGARRTLRPGGLLILYGPFLRADRTTEPSNLAFDEDLRQRNPAWGLRELGTVIAQAKGFSPASIVDMPANNLLVTLRRLE